VRLSYTRLTPALGALVHLSEEPVDITEEFADALHAGLMEHSVLVLPETTHLDPVRMVQLGRALGTLGMAHHSYSTHPDSDDVVVLGWGGDQKPDAAEWHADMTYKSQPPFASILKAVQIPPVGGDTLWASMFSVHDALDPGLRRDLEELEAVHDMGAFRTDAYLQGGDEGIKDAMNRSGTATHHVIEHHPVTDRAYVNVSESFTRFIIGMSAPESARILTYLFDLINRPEHHVRVRWQQETTVIWDNRGTQHYAVADYLPHRRVMHRVAVVTDSRSPGVSRG
jgi:taurine dioxygenase